MTLIIENVKKEYVEAFQGLANGVQANMKTLMECSIDDNISENGYTDEFERELLAELNEAKQQREAGTLKAYNSAKEMHDEIFERNILEKEVCNA